MEDELMFSMEECGSAKRPDVQRSALKQRASSLSDANASDDDDEDHFICPILDDSAREVCHYLKNLVYSRQLSNSLPKSNFTYKVSCCSRSTSYKFIDKYTAKGNALKKTGLFILLCTLS